MRALACQHLAAHNAHGKNGDADQRACNLALAHADARACHVAWAHERNNTRSDDRVIIVMRAPVHGRLAHVEGHEAHSSSLCARQRPQAVTLVANCIRAIDVARYLPTFGQLARGGRRLGACARGVWAVPRGVVPHEARVQPRNVEAVHVDAIKGFPAAASTARTKGLTRRRVSNRVLS